MATRRILSAIDLRSSAEREGITKTQQTVTALAKILETAGQAEQVRQERQDLDGIATALAGGATITEAIAAAKQKPEFSGGITGLLQRGASAFQPQPGRIGQGIQEDAIGSRLREILSPSLLSREEEREIKLFGQRDRPGAAAVAAPTKQQTQRDRDLAIIGNDKKSDFQKAEARKRLDKDPSQPRNPLPPGGTYDEFLEQAEKEAIGTLKEGGLFGKKAYAAALKLVEDEARKQGFEPKDAKVDFDRWWDARVASERGGVVRRFKTNTVKPRSEFQELDAGDLSDEDLIKILQNKTQK